MIVAEGLLMYLSESLGLFQRLTSHFQSGQLALTWSRLAVQIAKWNPSLRATGAQMRWGVDDCECLNSGAAPPARREGP